MRPLSRRRALQLGGLGIAGIVVGSAGLAWAGTTRYDPVVGENLTAPAVLSSTAGNLTLTLEAAAVGHGDDRPHHQTDQNQHSDHRQDAENPHPPTACGGIAHHHVNSLSRSDTQRCLSLSLLTTYEAVATASMKIR